MAAVPVIINNAMVVDYYDRVIGGPYKIVGNMFRADVGVGGGPVVPPEGGKPPGIWPGPGDPDYPAGSPHPEHPIVIPRPPVDFPNPPEGGVGKPPPPGGGWGYHPDYGWGYFPGTGLVPGPKA